jgi:uncharacterized OsmC-like protein
MSDDLLPPSVDPKIKTLGIRRVSGKNMATPRTVMMVRDHIVVSDEKETNTGPTPLEMALSALIGCEGVGFAYSAVDMDADGEVDQRGSRGVVGVRPYFNWVNLRIRVHSLENSERFEKLIRNVEYRCPVLNLFRAADVPVDITWERLDP